MSGELRLKMTNAKLENKIQDKSVIFFRNYGENNVITLLEIHPKISGG